MNKWFDSYWESQLYSCGLAERYIELWKERRKLDKECSVEDEIDMLRACQFTNYSASGIIGVCGGLWK